MTGSPTTRKVERAAAKHAAARHAMEESIREAHAHGVPLRTLAEAAGLSHETIRRLVVPSTDPVAGAIHAARAEEHHVAATKLRAHGRTAGAEEAERAARDEDDIAYMLRTGTEPRKRA